MADDDQVQQDIQQDVAQDIAEDGGLQSYANPPDRGTGTIVPAVQGILEAGQDPNATSSASNPRFPLGSETNQRPTRGVEYSAVQTQPSRDEGGVLGGYVNREGRMPQDEYDAAAKQVDPNNQMDEGVRHAATIKSLSDPDKKVAAMLYGAHAADHDVALARAAGDQQHWDVMAQALNHAVNHTPNALGTKFTGTNDGLVINVPGQDNPIVLTPEQASEAVHNGAFGFDNLMRDGVVASLQRVQGQKDLKREAETGGLMDTGQRGSQGPQGPGSETPAPEGSYPTRQQLTSTEGFIRDADVPRAEWAKGTPERKKYEDWVSGNDMPMPKTVGEASKQADTMAARRRGLDKQADEDTKRSATSREQQARAAEFDRAAQGAEQFRAQTPAGQQAPAAQTPARQQAPAAPPTGQAANPRGRGTFIPDANNPGHGAWTGGEEGPQGGSRLTPQEAAEAAEFTSRHPIPQGYAITEQSGGQPVTSTITGAKNHDTYKNSTSKRGSSHEESHQSEPVYSQIAGAPTGHGAGASARGLALDEAGQTAGERTAHAAAERQTVETEIKDLHARRAAGEQLSPEDQQLLDNHRALAREIMGRRGGGAQAQQPDTTGGVPVVRSADDYSRLPRGAIYTDPSGTRRTKQ